MYITSDVSYRMLLKQRLKLYGTFVTILISISWLTVLYYNFTHGSASRIHNEPGLVVSPYPDKRAINFPEFDTGLSQTRRPFWQERTLYSATESKTLTPSAAYTKHMLTQSQNSEPILKVPRTDMVQTHALVSDTSLEVNNNPTERFLIKEHLTLPMPQVTLPIDKLLSTKWMKDLKTIVATIPPDGAPISIASSDYHYREILLNWLISAIVKVNPPLTHIIVLCLDQTIHQMLQERGINSIYAPANDYLTREQIMTLTKHVAFTEVQVLRLTMMRLLNHWGYDVANYDTDALIVNNPESLYTTFNDSDLIGSYGHHPGDIRAKWGGVTVCCGMFMVRSTQQTEDLWNAMSTVLPKSYNDQSRLNHALDQLRPDWGDSKTHDIMDKEWVGTTKSGFRVTILPGKHVCRQKCARKRRDMYYVWHKGGSGKEGKVSYAQQGRLWFLRKDWEEVTNSSRTIGIEWLRGIAMN